MFISNLSDVDLKLENFRKLDFVGTQENEPSAYEKYNTEIDYVE